MAMSESYICYDFFFFFGSDGLFTWKLGNVVYGVLQTHRYLDRI
jgi:hypothetical protein